MTEAERYAKLRELLPQAEGATVDELIESQAKLIGNAQARLKTQSQTERLWQTQCLSPQGAINRQVPPGDKP
jgi:type VI protein secretion system component VasK